LVRIPREEAEVRVRIGMTMTGRELDLEVEDAEEVVRSFQQAMDQGEKVLWIVDEEGHRHGLVVDKIAYVDVEAEKSTRIGFGKE
jgi:hypothetical protein